MFSINMIQHFANSGVSMILYDSVVVSGQRIPSLGESVLELVQFYGLAVVRVNRLNRIRGITQIY